MTYVWDTDTFSAWQRRVPALVGRVAGVRPPDRVVLTAVTAFEVLRGRIAAAASESDERKHSRLLGELIDSLDALRLFQILPFGPEDAARTLSLRAGRGNRGRSDLRIAAIVLGAGGVLVTRNVSHFEGLPGLAIENWVD